MTTARPQSLRAAALGIFLCLQLASCTTTTPTASTSNDNLWQQQFANTPQHDPNMGSPPPAGPPEVTGYWEGQVPMGEVRLKIEPAQISMAIKCDKDAKIVSQGSAPIELKTGDQSRMVLLEDLKVDEERCGFKFNKGAEFSYILSANGLLLVNFANASNGMFKRLSN